MSSTNLKSEIADLRSQVQHLQAAIDALDKPSREAPSGQSNQLAEILRSSLERLDSEEERQRSLETTRLLMQEVKGRLASKEAQLKQISNQVSASHGHLSELVRRFTEDRFRLIRQWEEIQRTAAAISADWEVVEGCKPIQQQGEVAFPSIRYGNGTFFIVEADGQSQ